MQYDLVLKGHTETSVLKKKPMQMILGVLKSDSDPNRSPLGSPPIEKKRLRRLSNALLATSAGTHSPTQHLTRQMEDKENLTEGELRRLQSGKQRSSILKKRVGSVVKAHPMKCSHNRRVQFNGEVLVQYIGDKDTCHERLTETQDRMAFIARNILRRTQSQDCCDSAYFARDSLQNCQSTSQLPTFQDNPLYKAPITTVTKTEQGGKSVNISFSQNSRGSMFMKFVVFMGLNYDPDNIVVKANMSGNRLRVVANKVSHHHSTTGDIVKEEYNERFQLPMQVDPYKVEARLDSRGYLTVNAPLMTTEVHKVAEQKSLAISV